MPERIDLARLSRLSRVVAALLALLWLGAGLVAVVLGIAERRWLLALPGIFALWYGWLWVRVAIKARRLPWPEGLWPGQPARRDADRKVSPARGEDEPDHGKH